MILIEDFKSYNLTKRARITLEEGLYLGETYGDVSVYKLSGFWVLLDEDLTVPPEIPSYAAVKSAEAVSERPLINPSTDPDIDIKLA